MRLLASALLAFLVVVPVASAQTRERTYETGTGDAFAYEPCNSLATFPGFPLLMRDGSWDCGSATFSADAGRPHVVSVADASGRTVAVSACFLKAGRCIQFCSNVASPPLVSNVDDWLRVSVDPFHAGPGVGCVATPIPMTPVVLYSAPTAPTWGVITVTN